MRATEAKRPREGSRKAKVYDLYHHEGTKEAAIAYGLTLGLKESTIRSWIGTWKKNRTIQVADSK
jgi:transposase